MSRSTLPRLLAILCVIPPLLGAATPEVPDWALPGSATHTQVPPPKDFHRPTRTDRTPLGAFEGQSDVGGSLVAGSSSYDAATGRYTLNSAGYNIWYTRDEFRFVWKKMSGDVSLAGDISFPVPGGYDDRKVVLIIRQDLDDDAKEMMVALHGAGLIHLADRPEKNAEIKETFRLTAAEADAQSKPGAPKRLGIEKKGDEFALYLSLDGGPMQQVGTKAKLGFNEPFYVGIGFTSHLPVTSDTGVVSNLVLENAAGKVK